MLSMRAMRCALHPGFIILVAAPGSAQTPDWRADWEVIQGFKLAIDTEGYDLPTAIAFVPHPGSAPGDPLYFVTELAGRVRVVTNDRSVHTFVEGFVERAPVDLTTDEGQNGVAGICLAPDHGYVFVTFSYLDSARVRRNNILRFDTEPRTFSLRPRAQRSFAKVLSGDRSSGAHQIGECQVQGGLLYVSVGDGFQPTASRSLNSTLGKILRMTLDGEPAPGNPFRTDRGTPSAADYVWAVGFRNPFGLKAVGSRLFAAENGVRSDRFLEIERGGNYLWDGSEWSIGTNAAVVFAPAVAPVHVDYNPPGSIVFPAAYRDRFYIATAGRPSQAGPGEAGEKSVLMLDYDLAERRVRSVPRTLLRFRGTGHQVLSGVSFGSDGLYVVPILPIGTGRGAVLKVTHDPEHAHPFVLDAGVDARTLISRFGCRGCHVIGVGGGTTGPSLASSQLVARLTALLNSDAYIRSLADLDTVQRDPFPQYRRARREVAASEGIERVRTWVKYRIIEPRFEGTASLMPNLGVSDRDAEIIANYLIRSDTAPAAGVTRRIATAVRSRIPPSRHRYTIVAFTAGALLALGAVWLTRRFQHRKP